jgi:NAD(P)-dependent dehydrogenase (short-subunit alcohol dehydrogenase family)
MKDPRHVAVTGASGRLGRALALEYARPGMLLSLCGRDARELEKTAGEARGAGAEVAESLFDARDGLAISAWLEGADRRAPLELVIANAGVCRGTGPDGLEDPAEVVETLRVNAESAILTAFHAARLMLPRGRGQIAVISSQAGKVPLTYTPAYSASKAAARSYALSLRDGLAASGVEVTCVCPGYIESPMQATFSGGLFRPWTAGRAASAIASRLRRNPREIRFPALMTFLVWAMAFAPCPLVPWLLRTFSFRVDPAKRPGGEAGPAAGPGAGPAGEAAPGPGEPPGGGGGAGGGTPPSVGDGAGKGD